MYYFDKRLARANGTAFAGVGIGIFAVPPLLQITIDYYGWQGALLIFAAIVGNIGVCAAIYKPSKLEIENRTGKQKTTESQYIELNRTSGHKANLDEPEQTISGSGQTIKEHTKQLDTGHSISMKSNQTDTQTTNIHHDVQSKYSDSDLNKKSSKWSIFELFDFMLLTNFTFVLLLIAQIFHGIAYNIIIYYLSERAVISGISKLNAAYLLSAIGISSTVSRLTHGYIIDYHILSATVLTAIAYAICGVCSLLNPIWDNYAVLMSLSVPVGLTSGIFNSTVPIVAKEYVGANKVSAGTGWMLLIIGISIMIGQYLTGEQRVILNRMRFKSVGFQAPQGENRPFSSPNISFPPLLSPSPLFFPKT